MNTRYSAELSAEPTSSVLARTSSATDGATPPLYEVKSVPAVILMDPATRLRSLASRDGNELPAALQGTYWQRVHGRIFLTLRTLIDDTVHRSEHMTAQANDSESVSTGEPAAAERVSATDSQGAILISDTVSSTKQIFSLLSKADGSFDAQDASRGSIRAIFGSLAAKSTPFLGSRRLSTRLPDRHIGRVDDYQICLRAYVPTKSEQDSEPSVPLVLRAGQTVLYLEKTSTLRRSSSPDTATGDPEASYGHRKDAHELPTAAISVPVQSSPTSEGPSDPEIGLEMSASSWPSSDPNDPFSGFSWIPDWTPK